MSQIDIDFGYKIRKARLCCTYKSLTISSFFYIEVQYIDGTNQLLSITTYWTNEAQYKVHKNGKHSNEQEKLNEKTFTKILVSKAQ